MTQQPNVASTVKFLVLHVSLLAIQMFWIHGIKLYGRIVQVSIRAIVVHAAKTWMPSLKTILKTSYMTKTTFTELMLQQIWHSKQNTFRWLDIDLLKSLKLEFSDSLPCLTTFVWLDATYGHNFICYTNKITSYLCLSEFWGVWGLWIASSLCTIHSSSSYKESISRF